MGATDLNQQWVRALEELKPQVPSGSKRAAELAKLWKKSLCRTYQILAEMEAAGKASRFKSGSNVYWSLTPTK